jgi:PhnB protein
MEEYLMPVKPVPDGYPTVSPYLIVRGVSELVGFLKHVFEAEEIERIPGPDGAVSHAEVRIGDAMVMMGEAPEGYEPKPGSCYVYVPDVDAVYERALEAGATSVMEPADQFYGDRTGGVEDASGSTWWIATHIEDVSHEELLKRAAARAQGGG